MSLDLLQARCHDPVMVFRHQSNEDYGPVCLLLFAYVYEHVQDVGVAYRPMGVMDDWRYHVARSTVFAKRRFRYAPTGSSFVR
jgi:hypothetical protein